MAFIFTMRSTPVSGNSMHRRDNSLPAISEDGGSFLEPRNPPPVPPRAWNRPEHRNFALGSPPSLSFDKDPPPYTHFDESQKVTGPKGEKLSELRRELKNNKHIAKRGGWKRLAIIALVIILCIIALGVGLGVGLKNRKSSSEKNVNSPTGGASGTVNPPTDTTANATFPAGTYRVDTYLNTISTNCSSNPLTWRCYPYFTYATSPTQSTAMFDWIISPAQGSNNYTISSTDNKFSIMFSNATLSLMNAGADDEHYYFRTMIDKPNSVVGQLGSSTAQPTCTFYSTTFQGYLFTKMPKTFTANSTNSSTDTNAPFPLWPYAVRVEQVAGASPGSPTCVGPSGENLGDYSVSDGSQLCECLYMNTGT